MMKTVKRLAQSALSLVRSPTVIVDGMVIPAKRFRFGGAHFQDDRAFLETGKAEARKLIQHCNLHSDSSVLEIGCGPGRLPIGILAELGELKRYEGVDVSAPTIQWCTQYLTPQYPQMHFTHLDIYNARYNKSGTLRQEDVRLPYGDSECDCIYLYSVFSHLLTKDIEANLKEFARVLRPGGKVLLTAFVEDNVPNETENPSDYGPFEWKGPLHCVRFHIDYLFNIFRGYGFEVEMLQHGAETDGQSAIVLTRV